MLRGEGPVKHYVESFFGDYPRIREGRGVLDDWATPLDAYVRAAAFRIAGVRARQPAGAAVRRRQGVQLRPQPAGTPGLYVFARRRFGPRVALWAMARAGHPSGPCDLCGVHPAREPGRADLDPGRLDPDGGLAGRSRRRPGRRSRRPRRNLRRTGHPRPQHGDGDRRRLGVDVRPPAAPSAADVAAALVGHRRIVILPWAAATYREYGRPFHSYTSYFEYNFSWTVHHYEKGNTRPEQFYTPANAAGDRPGEGQVADHHRRLLDDDRGLAARRGIRRPSEAARTTRPRDRPAGRDDLGGVRAGDAEERRRCDPGRPARPLLLAGLRADAADRGRGHCSSGSTAPGPPSIRALAGRDVCRDGLGRPDLGLRRLVVRPSAIQLHWPALREAGDWVQAASGPRCRRTPGS